jgi:hypothetical protein
MKVCSVISCSNPYLAKGMCRKHYYRNQRTGTTADRLERPPVERFWAFVNKEGVLHPALGRCWTWTGGKFRGGYGALHVRGETVKAHRFSYRLHFGPFPESQLVCHRCDNPECTNPRHLFLSTESGNMMDRDQKGRGVRGERQHKAKLTEDVVRQIRARHVRRHSVHGSLAMSREFGVCHLTVLRVLRGDCWKHVV